MPNVYDPSQKSGVSVSSGSQGGGFSVRLDDLIDVSTVGGQAYQVLYRRVDGTYALKPVGYGTILGYYPNQGALTTAHPTGLDGQAYIVSTDLYIWDSTQWRNVGPFRGEPGESGEDGSGIVVKDTATWAVISAVPTPAAGDMWVLAATESGIGVAGDGLVWSGSAWTNVGQIRGPQGIQGIQGIQGVAGNTGGTGTQGVQGVPGLDGKTVLSGAGVPSNGLGVNGDFYLNTSATTLYGPKAAGVWGAPVSLVGPQGTTGIQGIQGIAGSAGSAGTAGAPGAAGTDGKTLRSGTGAPSNGLGVDGDFYINTTANTLYGPKSGGVWGSSTSLVGPQGNQGVQGNTGAASTVPGPQGDPGIQGIQGIQGNTGAASTVPGPPGNDGADGADGAAGTNGVDGKTVRSGSGVPSNGLGVDGDFYINTAANTLYGPKAAGVWGSSTSIVGPAGSTGTQGIQGIQGIQGNAGNDGAAGAAGSNGADGAAGADGKTVRSGAGTPSNGFGVDGDFYINTSANTIYGPKAAGSWGSPTSIVGPAGSTGTQGIQGVQGNAGTAAPPYFTAQFGGIATLAQKTYDARLPMSTNYTVTRLTIACVAGASNVNFQLKKDGVDFGAAQTLTAGNTIQTFSLSLTGAAGSVLQIAVTSAVGGTPPTKVTASVEWTAV